jgi:hypothetical protein
MGTDDLPYKYTELPTTKTDNHMICTYFDGQDYYFLDGTASFLPLGLNPYNIQGKQVLVGRGAGDYLVLDVPQTPAEVSFFRDSVQVKIEGNKLTGSGTLRTGGYFAERYASIYASNAKAQRREQFVRGILTKGNNKFVLDHFELLNPLDIGQGFDLQYNFSIDNYLTTAGDELFLNPHLEKQLQNEFIKEGTRLAYFSKFSTHYVNINCFEIPKDLKILRLPEDVLLENDDLLLRCTYRLVNGVLEVAEEVMQKNRMVPEERFAAYNELITQANKVYKNTVTLKKIK